VVAGGSWLVRAAVGRVRRFVTVVVRIGAAVLVVAAVAILRLSDAEVVGIQNPVAIGVAWRRAVDRRLAVIHRSGWRPDGLRTSR
jgi:hypothetical protein